MQKGNEFRVDVRRVFKRIFYVLLDWLEIRRSETTCFSAHFYRARRLSLISARIVDNFLRL
jgi:hypothetical protein